MGDEERGWGKATESETMYGHVVCDWYLGCRVLTVIWDWQVRLFTLCFDRLQQYLSQQLTVSWHFILAGKFNYTETNGREKWNINEQQHRWRNASLTRWMTFQRVTPTVPFQKVQSSETCWTVLHEQHYLFTVPIFPTELYKRTLLRSEFRTSNAYAMTMVSCLRNLRKYCSGPTAIFRKRFLFTQMFV